MHVAIHETRDERAAFEIDPLRIRSREWLQVRQGANRLYTTLPNGDRLDRRNRLVHRENGAAEIDHIGGLGR